MELTNKRTQYSVKNTVNGITLIGEVSLNAEDKIQSISGNFRNEEDNYVGDFYYSVNAEGKINKNINNIAADIEELACKTLGDTVAAINEEINK